MFCSPDCQKDFHVAARHARRALEKAIAIEAQYRADTKNGIRPARQEDDAQRAALRSLVKTVLEVASGLRADTLDDSRIQLIDSCLRALDEL